MIYYYRQLYALALVLIVISWAFWFIVKETHGHYITTLSVSYIQQVLSKLQVWHLVWKGTMNTLVVYVLWYELVTLSKSFTNNILDVTASP